LGFPIQYSFETMIFNEIMRENRIFRGSLFFEKLSRFAMKSRELSKKSSFRLCSREEMRG